MARGTWAPKQNDETKEINEKYLFCDNFGIKPPSRKLFLALDLCHFQNTIQRLLFLFVMKIIIYRQVSFWEAFATGKRLQKRLVT